MSLPISSGAHPREAFEDTADGRVELVGDFLVSLASRKDLVRRHVLAERAVFGPVEKRQPTSSTRPLTGALIRDPLSIPCQYSGDHPVPTPSARPRQGRQEPPSAALRPYQPSILVSHILKRVRRRGERERYAGIPYSARAEVDLAGPRGLVPPAFYTTVVIKLAYMRMIKNCPTSVGRRLDGSRQMVRERRQETLRDHRGDPLGR